ncbi:MAG: type 1 glutamine amidotransferase [Gammaproteobacteria bacterium]|nr:type 1 glutamine amidotransferase [Gammaproteobacteria bacterium]
MSQPDTTLRVFFIEMLGEPGTYDASVYDSLVNKDQEGLWFKRRYDYLGDVQFEIRSLPRGDSLPDPSAADGFILGGSYNSVHDNYPWQRAVLSWLPAVREQCLPLLAICGAHQLLGKYYGASVTRVANAPCAGTLPVSLTAAGMESPLFKSVALEPRFHFGNEEQVASVPHAASLLVTSDRVSVVALAYDNHWYSTQFHPEGSAATMGISWTRSKPALCDAYDDDDAGDQVIENFVDIVRQSVNGQS